MSDLSYLQAVVIGALQGVTELVPISSLGHSVLVPAVIGGSWAHLVTESSTADSGTSPYLAFVVALHVATALALLAFYWRDWVRIIGAFLQTVRTRRVETPSQRLAWLIVVGTVPVGVVGLLFEQTFRTLFAKPLAAAIFLTANGVILFVGEGLRRRTERRAADQVPTDVEAALSSGTPTGTPEAGLAIRPHPAVALTRRLDALSYRESLVIGTFQILALLAGISRSGITMVGGLLRGLDHEDAAKFAFLLATPVIFAAGVLKIPTLAGPAAATIHGPVVAGFLTAGVAAYLSVRFLTRYFTTRTLTPFGIYCLVAGITCIVRFA